jgi:hypothetical protein
MILLDVMDFDELFQFDGLYNKYQTCRDDMIDLIDDIGLFRIQLDFHLDN